VGETNVSRLIADIGQRYADRTALIDLSSDQVREISYAELVARTRALASALYQRGMRPGDRLAVALDNSTEMVVSEWCCLLAGFVWVALNVRSSEEELAGVLSDSDPALVITNQRYEDTLGRAASGRPVEVVGSARWTRFVENSDPELPRLVPRSTDPVRIRYTSGTSGRAKGAILTRGGYDASIDNVSSVIGPFYEDDVVAQVAPMTHASGAMLLPHLAAGGKAVIVDRFDAGALQKLCKQYRVTALFLVPTMLVRFLSAHAPSDDLETLRTIVYGGASTPPDTIAGAVESLGAIFIQIYGLTESTWPVCALGRDEHERGEDEARADWLARLASCGRPTAVGRVRIVNESGTDVDDGQAGELWVRGRNTMAGYWRSADEGDKGLDTDGWMHTGDIGVRDEQGRITIVDRLHDMIVSGGFNVYPREIEDALGSHDGVLESAVVGRPHSEWGEAVHAYVVVKAGMQPSADELRSHVSGRVAGYKSPKTIEFVDSLPKNTSGKVLRRVLRDRLRPG
jgi:acyl-CoA synthetase (AMP-forming)/AMP-acid ligase II